jgi:uncharacterized protein YkwD
MKGSLRADRVGGFLALATMLAALAACGGGSDGGGTSGGSSGGTGGGSTGSQGGGSSGATGTGGSDAFALQASPAAADFSTTDDGGVLERATFDLLNTVRVGAGAGAVDQDVRLQASAYAHASYLLANNDFGHYETAGKPGFTGTDPWTRGTANGYAGTVFSEVLTQGSSDPQRATVCLKSLLDTVYHMRALMGPYREVGIGFKPDATGSGDCNIDLGYKGSTQLPVSGTVVPYPYDGQVDVSWIFHLDSESPRPLPALSGDVGQPILASMASRAILTSGPSVVSAGTVDAFVLEDAAGNVVPAYVVAPKSIVVAAGIETADDAANDIYYARSDVMLVPKAALAMDATYTVSFSGTFNGVAHKKTWSFTTGDDNHGNQPGGLRRGDRGVTVQ